MLIIISDSHDNLTNLDKALAFAKSNQAEAIIHCGDLCNSDTLEHLATAWTKPIYLVQGNGELYDLSELKKYPNIINLGRSGGVFNYQTLKIGVCHEPKFIEDLLIYQPDFIFYGHTHRPWEDQRNSARVINPGNLDGSRHLATFATCNTSDNELQLVLLNNL